MSARVFLIEPQWRAVREYQIEYEFAAYGLADFDAFVRAVLGCRTYAKSPPLAGDFHGGFDVIYYSGSKLRKRRDNPQFWFQIDICVDPIPGCGLVLGTDADGSIHSVRISSADLLRRLCFTQRAFSGYKKGNIPGTDLKVNRPVAPMIEHANWEMPLELRAREALPGLI